MSKKENRVFSELLLSELNQEDNVELIDLIADQDPEDPAEHEIAEELAILPLRNSVLFPGVVIPITVGRTKSIRLVKDAHKGSKLIGVVAQKNVDTEDPVAEDLFTVGTLAKIIKMIALPDGNTTIIIQGKYRFKVEKYIASEPVIKAKVSALEEDFHSKDEKETEEAHIADGNSKDSQGTDAAVDAVTQNSATTSACEHVAEENKEVSILKTHEPAPPGRRIHTC